MGFVFILYVIRTDLNRLFDIRVSMLTISSFSMLHVNRITHGTKIVMGEYSLILRSGVYITLPQTTVISSSSQKKNT